MTREEQNIKTAAKLYEARDTMKGLFGDRYPEKVGQYRNIIRNASKQLKCDVLVTAPRIVANAAKAGVEIDGVGVALLLAATVEELESMAAEQERDR